jgi:hypothetical protein
MIDLMGRNFMRRRTLCPTYASFVSIRQHTSAYVDVIGRNFMRRRTLRRSSGTPFTCFTSTKVQILMQEPQRHAPLCAAAAPASVFVLLY